MKKLTFILQNPPTWLYYIAFALVLMLVYWLIGVIPGLGWNHFMYN